MYLLHTVQLYCINIKPKLLLLILIGMKYL